MGYILTGDEIDAGPFGAEVRSESFYLIGPNSFQKVRSTPCPPDCTAVGQHDHAADFEYVKQRHGIIVYPYSPGESNQGTVEILLEDIPHIRAALDAIENHLRSKRGGVPWE